MALFDLVVLVPIAAIAYLVLRRVSHERRLKYSAWCAFYFTVPLAIYDWLYCGVYLGHGMEFLTRFWYLSVNHAVPWVVLPALALVLNHGSAGKHTLSG